MQPFDDDFSNIKTVLSENIKRYRNKNNLSQEDLAELSGLHRTYIGSVERKERNVTLSTLIFIASALKTSVPDLLRKKEDE
ncbi:helix-turn-helix domain-containing protein [Klebsiella pasteurii]|jgi:transcriptional regulator with XRE-family HTH domain|uniref:helix-turn-helix domain-containing protein n=1 Tax=Klebsiella TaxID=570 RepID=UPI000A3D6A3E|nr:MULTISPECIES: helix-turn-helix transcriptional regulator [Klebsiella]ELT9692216.1 helix-turn-helix transcriptional regulator [Klebsiella michiganensis]HAX0147366.1 helix-turn-helix transcriptional regulator [Escherichia coli JJ2087]HAX0180849.1 helix-turn-helix transcriptional regulator [Escherichia coli JJ1908]ART03427.1 transcriptional regulator [Klebsiella pneumoniae]ART03433.1 transcriptional regulator [Klebsiella pneumoniae]